MSVCNTIVFKFMSILKSIIKSGRTNEELTLVRPYKQTSKTDGRNKYKEISK
jgi:hypothetical protein